MTVDNRKQKNAAARVSARIDIDRLSPKEATALQLFYNTLSKQARRWFRPLGWTASRAAVENVIADMIAGRRFDLVVRDGASIVAWAFLAGMEEGEPSLGIAVADGWRGRGIGSALMERLIAEARGRSMKRITLIHVEDNTRAHHVYVNYGFESTGAHVGEDGERYVEMALRLE